MIQKIQYLRKLLSVGMPGWGNINIAPYPGNNNGPVTNFDPNLTPVNPGTVPYDPNLTPVNPGTVPYDPTQFQVNPNIGIIPNPIVPTPVIPVTPVTPTSPDLIFNSINDLTDISNEPLVHSRDAGGNIILLNDNNTTNQLLTVESITYKVPSITVNSIIDTQFNYFKFPPRLSNIEVVDEINLNDAIDDIDLISTRYTPSLTSGRQSGLGREPILRAGRMISEGVDDTLVQSNPNGYYGNDYLVDSILNMETVLAGTEQLKPSKFIITPDMIENGEDLLFKIRVHSIMKVPTANDPASKIWINLNKLRGSTYSVVARSGNYHGANYQYDPNGPYTDELYTNLNNIVTAYDRYSTYLKQYNNLLTLISNRTTKQQQTQLADLQTKVNQSLLLYNQALFALQSTQTQLNNYLSNKVPVSVFQYFEYTYEIIHLVRIYNSSAYDEYSISTRCGTDNNGIDKDKTTWQVIPVSKIKNIL